MFLRNGVKMVFRGGPSVQPGLSVTSSECVVLCSVVLGAPVLHSQPREEAATLSPRPYRPLRSAHPAILLDSPTLAIAWGKGAHGPPKPSLPRVFWSLCTTGGRVDTNCLRSLLSSLP